MDGVVLLRLAAHSPFVSSKMSPRTKWLVALSAALAAYTLVGFLLAPMIVRDQATKRLGELLGREVSIEKVEMNPFRFSMAVHNLRIIDLDGQDLATWELVYGNFDPLLSIFKLQWHLGEARVVKPRKYIRIDESGVVNVTDVLENFGSSSEPESEDEGGLPSIGIGSLSVEGWAVEVTDLSLKTPFRTVIGPMTFSATDFTTRPDIDSPYTFAGTTDSGETFSWAGTISMIPLGSRGRIEFSNVSIPKHMPFVEHLLNGSIGSGKAAFATDYEVALADTMTARIKNGTASIDTVELTLAGSPEPLVFLQHLEVDIARADLIARVAEIERVRIDGFTAHVERRADGSIDALDLLVSRENEPRQSGEGLETGPAPSVRIAEILIANGNTSIVDRTTTQPVSLLVDGISAKVTNAGTDLDREVDLEARFTVNNTGSLSITGKARPRPLAINLNIRGEGLALAPLNPYVQDMADVRVASGHLNFAGELQAEHNADGRLNGRWMGDQSVLDLSIEDAGSKTELLSWTEFKASGTNFSVWPLEFSAREISLSDPTANVVIAEDRSINLLNALGISPERETDQPGADEPPEVADDTGPPPLDAFSATIDAVTITGGGAKITDSSTAPEFSAQLHDFGGSIRGLSSENLARADVDLQGKLNTSGKIEVSGSINPLAEDRFSDVTVAISNVGLPRFSSYSGRYIGQKIESGTLNFDLKYKVSQNTLEGENILFMDQFYLGEKVESDESLGLPVGLAVALLRDRNGQIKLPPLEVRGNLDDPDFKYGRVLAHAIGTLIGKMATAPFSMLGGLFGGSEDQDISFVEFTPGETEIAEGETEKLQILANALYERPALQLQIVSPPNPEADREPLTEKRFQDMLREEQSTTETAPGTLLTDLSVEQIDGLIQSAYLRAFPEEETAPANKRSPSATKPVVSPDADESATSDQDPNLLKRVWQSVFGGAKKQSDPGGPPSEQSIESDPDSPSEPQPPTTAEMRARLIETIELTEADFQELAGNRAAVVNDQLLELSEIDPGRVSIAADPVPPEGAKPSNGTARVFFGLQ